MSRNPITTSSSGKQAQTTPEAHIELYEKYLAVSPFVLPTDPRMTRSTLWHWDLHASNLFVKDDHITCVIDWQSTWAGPLFLQYQYPELVRYSGEVMLRLPENYENMEKKERDIVSASVERSLVQYVYELYTKTQNPLLAEIRSIPQAATRKRLVEYSENTWDRDILPFRQCLIRLEKSVTSLMLKASDD